MIRTFHDRLDMVKYINDDVAVVKFTDNVSKNREDIRIAYIIRSLTVTFCSVLKHIHLKYNKI